VVGGGPERAGLEAMASQLGISESVCFLGHRRESRALRQEMDIVAHAPRYEGFGLVMIEAMAAGRPLVVNDAPGGMRELVQHEVNGLVVAAGSAEQLAGAIDRLAADPDLRRRLGEAGRAICRERYSAEAMAARTRLLYERLLGARR